MDVNVLPSILKSRVIQVLWGDPHGRVRSMDVNVLPSILKSRVVPVLW